MKITQLLGLMVSVFFVQQTFAATFEVGNKSGQSTLVSVSGKSGQRLAGNNIKNNGSAKYDTGAHSIMRITWTGTDERGRQGTFILQGSPLLQALKLNYNFYIFPEGHYSSDFAGGHFERGKASQFVAQES